MTVDPDPNPAPDATLPPYTVERVDSSITERWHVPTRMYRRYDSGALADERPFNDAENATADAWTVDNTRSANQALLLQRARAAIVTNQTYLDKVTAGTATNADHIAQVPVLTRQMQGVIRLLVGSDLLDQT